MPMTSLVARGKTVFHEAQFVEFVAVEHQVAPLLDLLLGLDYGAQVLLIRQCQIDEAAQTCNKRIAAPNVLYGAVGAMASHRP
jgi:hypothetical protein